jgi:GGDEF domain-containing protein
VSLRAAVVATAFLLAAGLLVRAYRKSTATGPHLVWIAFLLYGVEQLALFWTTAGPAGFGPRYGIVPFDLLMVAVLGIATVVWLLEDEHFRLVEASLQIEKLAYYDSLTGLPNRKLFLDRLKQWIERRGRTDFHAALFFLDLDNFKRINDTYGHDTGDQLLGAVADRLRYSVREGDTIGRQGGDEFTLLAAGHPHQPRMPGRSRTSCSTGCRSRSMSASSRCSPAPRSGSPSSPITAKIRRRSCARRTRRCIAPRRRAGEASPSTTRRCRT